MSSLLLLEGKDEALNKGLGKKTMLCFTDGENHGLGILLEGNKYCTRMAHVNLLVRALKVQTYSEDTAGAIWQSLGLCQVYFSPGD